MNVVNRQRNVFSSSSSNDVCGHLSTLVVVFQQVGRRRLLLGRRLHFCCLILLVLCSFHMTTSRRKQKIVLLQQQQQQQQQHVSTTQPSNNNTSITTHEQGVVSSSSLFVNHSADDDVFEQKEGCNNSNNRCRLEFVHIPKTGGTAVELAGLVANISWGACRFFPTVWINDHDKIPCPATHLMRIGKLRLRHQGLPLNAKRVNDWHLPPQYFDANKFTKIKGRNPYRHDDEHDATDYDDVALFAIVRDPYARAISEYYYTKTTDDHDPHSSLHNATIMNQWLEKQLAPLLENYTRVVHGEPPLIALTRPDETRSVPRSAVYFQRDGHFIPQYDYIFDGGGPQPRRVVHHVLHFEHLQTDFAKLMAAYNLSAVQLPDPAEKSNKQQQQQKDKNAAAADGGVAWVARRTRAKKLNKYNLTLDNIRRIETIYARDFATFGYPTISSEMEK